MGDCDEALTEEAFRGGRLLLLLLDQELATLAERLVRGSVLFALSLLRAGPGRMALRFRND